MAVGEMSPRFGARAAYQRIPPSRFAKNPPALTTQDFPHFMTRLSSIVMAAALIAAGLGGYWLTRKERPAADRGEPASPRSATATAVPADSLAGAFGALTDADGSRTSLGDLKATLASLPKDQAVAMIRGFLDSGRDKPTGMSFVIAPDGSLSEWPTFRAFLLDSLGTIDPVAAAAIGRDILASPTNADEWALALRNVARGEPIAQCADFLRAKTEELIRNPEWQAAPSIGYLNAFDVLVHIEATASMPLLSELIQRKDRQDLAHAGFLTLDRLVQRQPIDLLDRLAADAALQQSRPEMVAQQFARADLRDAAQQEIVRSWLLDPARTPAELRAFAGVFPNNNRFVSNNLLTREEGQSGEDLVAHDRDVLPIIAGWADYPEFQSVRPHLDLMISRLEGFVGANSSAAPPAHSSAPPTPE
jgi:hypothetical protein